MVVHIPILVKEIVENLPSVCQAYVDGTLWHGWHAQAILQTNASMTLIWIDRDPIILTKTKEKLQNLWKDHIYQLWSYADIQSILTQNHIKTVDLILLDIWVNMEHFKDYDRWFSIKWDGPLDMRFNPTQWMTAYDYIQQTHITDLESIFIQYGDFGKAFAQRVASLLKKEFIALGKNSTLELVKFLGQNSIWHKVAAVIFQCIRIAVNDELGELERFLNTFHSCLNSGWRCMIITFHSTEDRMVKTAFKELTLTSKFRLINKHVIVPGYQEKQSNKASTSAKLRIIEAL